MKIWFENRPVAELIAGKYGPSMRYDQTWIDLKGSFPVSTRMPLVDALHGPDVVVPWVVGLLPEDQTLQTIGKLTGTSTQDILGMLHTIGRDTSGAFSFERRSFDGVELKVVKDETDLERIINELPNKPFLVGEEGVSMSLAGVQSKLGVFVDDDKMCIPINGTPSTWILKPDAKKLPGSVWNEAFCMKLALNSDLDAPEVRVGRAGERRYILIKRYDRVLQSGRWRRRHQEDFTQAAGIFPSAKYEKNDSGTPGLKLADMINILRSITSSRVRGVLEIQKFMSYLIFNTIACNTDAHAKNYSVMISSDKVYMTPIYDVMCAKPYPHVTKYLANTVAGKREGDYFKGRHWQREAKACGLSPSGLLKDVERLCKRVLNELGKTYEEVVGMDVESEFMAGECRKHIRERAEFLLNGLKETESSKREY